MNASKTITITITAADAVAIRTALCDSINKYERRAMMFGGHWDYEIAADMERLADMIEEKRRALD